MPDLPAEADTDIPLLERSDDELRRLTNGCTELSCMYHGLINMELMRRTKEADRA